jgi:excisionase family DNA binding protein
VADLLGVSPNTVSRWAREGRLASISTLGGHRRFKADVVEDLMKRKPDESAPQDQDEES